MAAADRCPFCAANCRKVYENVRDYLILAGRSPEFAIVYCDACAIGFTTPPMTVEELAPFYPTAYEPYVRKGGFAGRLQSAKYAMDLRLVAPFLPKGASSFFEIGAGRGEFLATAKSAGHRVTGLEPSEAGRQVALREWGIELLPGFVDNFDFKNAYDLVAARHVAEHINRPDLIFAKVFQSGLRSGGRLFLKLPNYDCWERRLFGKFWSGLDVPRHRVHFTPAGIKKLLESLGFADVKVSNEIVPIDFGRNLDFAGQNSGNAAVQLANKLFKLLPTAVQFLVSQTISLLGAPFGAGRMIVMARRP